MRVYKPFSRQSIMAHVAKVAREFYPGHYKKGVENRPSLDQSTKHHMEERRSWIKIAKTTLF